MKIGTPFLFILLYAQVISTQDSYTQTYEQGYHYYINNDFEAALIAFEKTIELNSKVYPAYYNIGVIYKQKNDYHKAIEYMLQSVLINQKYTKAYIDLASLYLKIGEKNNAKKLYQKVLKYDEDNTHVNHHLGKIYLQEINIKQSCYHLEKALKNDPQNIHILFDLVKVKDLLGEYEQALELCILLEDILPDDASILYNIAHILKKLCRLNEALPYYKKALKVNPDHENAHYGYSQALLGSGQWTEEAWREYEWRWINKGQSNYPIFKGTLWDGCELKGKIIYLRGEQCIGDQFQFIRYAKLAKKMGATTIVAVSSSLISCLKTCPYIDTLLTLNDENIPPYDIYAPFSSCPGILKETPENIPNEIPYLYANDQLVSEWRDTLSQDKNFKVGICWHASPFAKAPLARMVTSHRSISLKYLEPLFAIPGTSFYSLQINNISEYKLVKSIKDQLNELSDPSVIKIFGEDFDKKNGSFVDTAAVIKNLDLVISVDTSVCHFAGGMGDPTWLLLAKPTDWRWLLDRDDTPWYPNMKIFRQPKHGDWESVIKQVEKELKELVIAHTNKNHSYN